MSSTVNFVLKDENAQHPTKGTKESVGYDLYSPVSITLKAKQVTKIDTGVQLIMPQWIWAQILDRSSMGKNGMKVFGGVIDPDYMGTLGIMIYNSTNHDYAVTEGDRIAQLVFHYAITPKLEQAPITLAKRGENGFGSTGK